MKKPHILGAEERFEWSSDSLEHSRSYMFKNHPEFVGLLHSSLQIKPGMQVVDVGCGTGFYTRLIAQALKGRGNVLGIDMNDELLKHARSLVKKSKLSGMVKFRKGDVYKLPLPDNYADLIFCNAVLWQLRDPDKPLQEMKRVVKPGGTVSACEPDAETFMCYDPNDQHYCRLAKRALECFAKGVSKLQGYDFYMGRKLPTFFIRAGLEDVRMYPRYGASLACDAKNVSFNEKLDHLRWMVRQLTDVSAEARKRREWLKKMYLAGGMSETEFENYRKRNLERMKLAIKYPERINTDTSVVTWGAFIVVAKKPK